ncbi:MAG: hypothetical protein WBD34_18140 [Burkholderiaceae bacterium]
MPIGSVTDHNIDGFRADLGAHFDSADGNIRGCSGNSRSNTDRRAGNRNHRATRYAKGQDNDRDTPGLFGGELRQIFVHDLSKP